MTAQQATRWAAVVAAVGAGIVAAAHIGKVPPVLPAMRGELSLSLVEGGWVVSMFNALGLVSALALGLISDRFGARRMALLGLGALVVGGVTGAAAQGPLWLLAGRAVEGIGFISVAVTAPTLVVAATAPHQRRLTLGLWSIYNPAGTATMMLAAPLLAAVFGWRGLWVIVALLAAVMAAALWRLAEAPPPRPAETAREVVGATLRRPGLWLFALAFGTYTLQWTSLMVWLPSFLVENRGAGGWAAAALTALAVAVNVPGNLAAGWLLHRNTPRWLLITGPSIVMGLCGAGIFSDALPDSLRYALCLVFSGFGGMIPAAVLAGAPQHAPRPSAIGAANGLIVQGSNIGQFAGPPAVAAVVTAAGGDWSAAAALMLTAASVAAASGLAVAVLEARLTPSDRVAVGK